MSVRKALVTCDAHVDYEDKRAWKALLAYAAEERWDYWLDLGDFLDLKEISRHVEGKPRQTESLRLAHSFAAGRKLLRDITKAVRAENPDCRMVMLEGNHEFRIQYWLDKYPVMEGLISVTQQLALKELGIGWVPSWSGGKLYQIGKVMFTHGLYTNKYHTEKHARTMGYEAIFYGHTHDHLRHTLPLHGKNRILQAESLGCMCRLDMPYMRGRPDNWEQGFTVFWFEDNGSFQHQFVRIRHGRFRSPTNGKIYRG